MNRGMAIDLFELTDKNDIKFRANNPVRESVKTLIFKIKNENKLSWKDTAKRFGITYETLWDYMNRSTNIPLIFIKNISSYLNEEEKIKIQSNISELTYGRFSSFRKVTIPKMISLEMVKIAGAIISDGYLQEKTKLFNSGRYDQISRIVIRDQNEDAISLCCRWFNKTFNIDIKARKGKNHWYISFGNKIIFRYFSKIFNIPVGEKSSIVRVPEIVNRNTEFKKSFVQSVFLFEGGIDHRTGYAEIGSKSRELIYGLAGILTEFGLKPDFVSKYEDRNGWKLRIRNKSKLSKFLDMFCERGTMKYRQLKFHLKAGKKNLNKINSEIDVLFPRTRKNTINYRDVINSIQKLENSNIEPTFKNVKIELNREKTVVYEYLRKLETLGLLKSNKIGLIKVWGTNKGVQHA